MEERKEERKEERQIGMEEEQSGMNADETAKCVYWILYSYVYVISTLGIWRNAVKFNKCTTDTRSKQNKQLLIFNFDSRSFLRSSLSPFD